MEDKIYMPYLISNSTILQYQDQDENQKLSLMEIIETFYLQNNPSTKYYFKVIKNKRI